MQAGLIDILTDAEMYRSCDDGPPVWPRHYSQFSCTITLLGWTICPLQTDVDVANTVKTGQNLSRAIGMFWAFYHDRTGRTELNLLVFEAILSYLVHCTGAPCFTDVYDQWRSEHGLNPWGLAELANEHYVNLLEVETPTELVQCVEAMLKDGFDFLSPTSRDDVQWLRDALRAGQ
jgi:hypothetical protein